MDRMHEYGISSMVVEPDGNGEWGIMTQRDIVKKIVGADKSARNVTLGEIASKPLITVAADLTLSQVSRVMVEHNVRRVAVERQGEPVGIVSETDLFNVVQEFGWEPEE